MTLLYRVGKLLYLCRVKRNTIMVELSKKTQAFEYFVYQLYNWYIERYSSFDSNDLSMLKVLKLLFFCTAIEAEKDKDDTLLDLAFDNFYAMPYGHVESDVYNAIKKNELSFFKIDRDKTLIFSNIEGNSFDALSNNIKTKIDSSFKKLSKENEKVLEMLPLDLVLLSHLWYSWRYYYNKAKEKGVYSEKIPNNIIKSENKVLYLY